MFIQQHTSRYQSVCCTAIQALVDRARWHQYQ